MSHLIFCLFPSSTPCIPLLSRGSIATWSRCLSSHRRAGIASDQVRTEVSKQWQRRSRSSLNYHWKGYSVETIGSTSNAMISLHRGNFPIHRLCHSVNIECRAFNLMEACTWVSNEKWNILWADDESWLPNDATVNMRTYLPHGFHKVVLHECDDQYLYTWLEIAGHGFYPFAAEARHHGYACWANSRRFAIVARSPQQCTIISEIMHAYNILGNRIETLAPCPGGIALAEQARIDSAVHEDDRACFDFCNSQTCLDAIAGRFPQSTGEADKLFQLSEGIHLLQRQHNDRIHEANHAIYRVQQSWHALSEAYAALFQ